MTAVQLDHGLVAALIGTMNDPHGLRAHRIPDAVEPRDQDEPSADPFALNSHVDPARHTIV